ncbi:MAG: cytochrome b/b6 domain-containing protein [Alphaproteobacteria bacterium]|nr:cytochrome b/b6 domain-containing protein [Alphaproteobacteria bacterium]MBU1514764.1 cytochrome b/b6 domain-containing protein [Alphaproteobacteria bacterium]MBU2093895.1 cytochrome b/b6 domain-containing protein [Alphaproteobacteria bacterium]MBU2153322.1 cytochrome b/b6 domain-containing protein [Alphaproteobacteria bacterium]MBU2309750.1 cytochrome b/b6 domain-containing protein [Alphaproteobacteria bacterium]
MAEPSAGVRAKLWDGPVRIVHWLLVVLIAFSWWASGDHLNWHRWSGYTIIALVLFRIYWGFAGGGAAKFSSFVKGPKAVAAYAATLGKRDVATTPGHNPLGALSVLAILAVLLVQVGTGLFAVDIDAFEGGPLSDRVSFELGREIADWHELSFRALQALVVLHVAAVLFYWLWKRTNLIGAMITGRRTLPSDPGLAGAPVWRLIAGVVLAAAIAWVLSKGFRL